MKRSTAIILGASGIILAAAWLGRLQKIPTEELTDAGIYSSLSDCVSANILTRETCEAEFDAATTQYAANAPRFSENNACEADYGAGQCKPATIGGANVFIPAMLGFLVANHLANQRQAQPLLPPNRLSGQTCPPGQTPQSMPGCVARSTTGGGGVYAGGGWRSYTTTNGQAVHRSASTGAAVKIPVAALSPTSHASPSSITRNGFGASARSFTSSSGT